MTLDLSQVTLQIRQSAGAWDQQVRSQAAALQQVLALLREHGTITPTPLPPGPVDYVVLATDGSQIEIDRHMPVPWSLINIGSVMLRYGARPSARLDSRPELYLNREPGPPDPDADDDDVPVNGAVLSLRRNILEGRELLELARAVPADLPTVALMDGSLLLGWEATRADRQQRELLGRLLREQYLPVLDGFQQLAEERPAFALASYISYPRRDAVVGDLRGDAAFFDKRMLLDGILDRDIFSRLLASGERSPVYELKSRMVDFYGNLRFSYLYLNGAGEIARVELPEWVGVSQERLDLAHTSIVQQCRLGFGYPVALIEAHEQAVVGTDDRSVFWQLVNEALVQQGLPSVTSAKSRSKLLRWV